MKNKESQSTLFGKFAWFQKKSSSKDLLQGCSTEILNLSPDACVILNRDNNEILCANDQFLSFLDLPADTALQHTNFIHILMKHLSSDSSNKDLIMNGIPSCWEGEGGFTTVTDKKIHAHIKSKVLPKGDTELQLLFFRDITLHKQAETELKAHKQQVQKAAKAKARFLSSMSHELRTPLNGIIGTSHLILTDDDLPAHIKQNMQVLKYSSEHMLGIINDILDFSKIDAGKLELKKQKFNLKNCVENILGSFESQFKAKDIGINLICNEPLDDVTIFSDEIKLSQIFKNLISNALKFTYDGSVQLELSVLKRGLNNTTISFAVKDTGIGIPEDKLTEIFQGFVQVHDDELSRRHGGTGLGLTISERLVAKFGGQLKVESTLKEGSCFFFTLTFENAVATILPVADNTLSPAIKEDTRGLRVLVVEDNEINASILINFLQKWGIRIKVATNGIQALELFKYHKFDMVLMDLEMPEMDGYAAIKIIRETDRTTPVIAFTATLLENMDALISDTCFNDYILKPYRPAELKKKILQYAPHRKIEYAG